MEEIAFKVSARTAQLIGRENIANAEGAIIELVKNTYDADSKFSIVYFDNKFQKLKANLKAIDYHELIRKNQNDKAGIELLEKSYSRDKQGNYRLSANLSKKNLSHLQSFLNEQVTLYIIDGGEGMTDKVIRDYWMTLGTNNKLYQAITTSGRIKTGAKGIGRFALERLGSRTTMITKSKSDTKDIENDNNGYYWEVDWKDFEKQDAVLSDVKANLFSNPNMNFKDELNTILSEVSYLDKKSKRIKPFFNALDKKFDLENGTILKIELLRDEWAEKNINKLYESLEILTPPDGEAQLDLYLLNSADFSKYGEIDNKEFDDYDYKVEAHFQKDGSKNIAFKITRNELDLDLLSRSKVFEYKEMQEFPFTENVITGKTFEDTREISEVTGIKHNNPLLDDIGEFRFIFYFLKRGNPNNAEMERFFYKYINSGVRTKWLDKFGGIRIYRDQFRVRPYGKINSPYFDWLSLDKRQRGSRGVSTRTFKVGARQIAGSIHISRSKNLGLKDRSSREGLQENDATELFFNIIEKLIEWFETDRNTIMYNISQLEVDKRKREKEKRAKERKEAQVIIDRQKKKQQQQQRENKVGTLPLKTDDDNNHVDIKDFNTVSNALEATEDDLKGKEEELEQVQDELRLSRALASSGLLIASFAHEFHRIRTKLETRTQNLRKYTQRVVSEEKLNQVTDRQNPFRWIDKIQEQDAKTAQWIDFSINLTKKDRRKRKNIDLNKYIQAFKNTWNTQLKSRKINLELAISSEELPFKGFEVDLDTIFQNLLANSIEAFERPNKVPQRKIEIEVKYNTKKQTLIKYEDNAGGLDETIVNPNQIFKQFFTTKVDENGNSIGTGMGMWLLKTTVDDYNGRIDITKTKNGFGIQLTF